MALKGVSKLNQIPLSSVRIQEGTIGKRNILVYLIRNNRTKASNHWTEEKFGKSGLLF